MAILSDLSETRGIPKLSLRTWRGGNSRSGTIHYDEANHRKLPHIIKFSGGRSSGLMLLLMLRNNLLKAERGDVVLFTNTSAEHPATYDFIRKMKRVTEKENIPFFITQWQTVETVIEGEWCRKPTYRLANDRPLSKENPEGYSYRGEVFEEAIAWNGMLPSVYTRVCTMLMKIFVTQEFLSDWLASRQEIPEQGHRAKTSQIDPRAYYRRHQAKRGTMSFTEIQARWERLSRGTTVRPHQRFKDFTRAQLVNGVNEAISDTMFGNRCSLFGNSPTPFLTFLGFRAGEDARFQRMVQRNLGEKTSGHSTQPPGEHSYAPLFNLGIDQEQVLQFWSQQPRKLRPYLPTDLNLSNCVYCFLKGPRTLSSIGREKREFERKLPKSIKAECQKRNTPNSLKWWANLEESYRRNSRKANINGKNARSFGMFGLKDMSYRLIETEAKGGKKKRASSLKPYQDLTLSCECTD